MIIDFTVKNFCSIKDEQLFSLFAQSEHSHHTDNISFHNENPIQNHNQNIGTLKTAGIWGANASGKSNLLKAINALKYLITKSDSLKDGDPLPCYEPFLLAEETRLSPTSFEIEFWVKGKRFRYCIEFNQYEVLHETLDFYPTTKPANLYERFSATDWKTDEGIKFRKYYKGGTKRYPFFSNNTFLSKAGNSADSPEIIREVYQYFRNNITFISTDSTFNLLNWQDDHFALNAMKSLIKNTGLGIDDFHFENKEVDPSSLGFVSRLPDELKKSIVANLSKEAVFHHKTQEGDIVNFKTDKESLGTKRLLETLPLILMSLKNGSVLLCDEIENSFHAHVVELIIKLFQDPKINTHSAQLIFTTHSLSTLKPKFMRKDQMWLVEKIDGASALSSLDQFDSRLRNTSPFDKWYDEGRLGGIPSINYYEISKSIRALAEVESA